MVAAGPRTRHVTPVCFSHPTAATEVWVRAVGKAEKQGSIGDTRRMPGASKCSAANTQRTGD